MVSWIWLIFLINLPPILSPFPGSLLSGSSPVEALSQVEILPQYFLVMPQLITCPWSHSANKLISPYVEIVELFHSVLLQRMSKQICLSGFQGTVYRSARCTYRYNRSKTVLKKWETGKANCCGEKTSCLLFLYKLIKLKGCCHPYRQKPCPFPCTLFWRILQKPLCKGHLSAPAPSPGYVEKLYLVFFHASSAGFNSISQHAIAYQLWRICFLPYKSSIADIKRTVYLFGLKSSSSQGIWMVMKKSGILSIPVLPCQQMTICHRLKIFLRHPGIKQQI